MKTVKKYAILSGVVLGGLLLGIVSVQAALTIGSAFMTTGGDISINGVATSTFSIGTSTTSGTITIGGQAQTGNLVLGSSTAANTVYLGGGTGTTTVNIGTDLTSTKAISIGNTIGTSSLALYVGTGNFVLNGGGAATYSIGTSTTSGTITIGGQAQTGAITLGQSSGLNTVGIGTGTGQTTVNIVTGATNGNVVNIANGAVPNQVMIGSTNGTSSLTLQAGTGRIFLSGQLVSSSTVPVAGAGTASVAASSTDTAGSFTSVNTGQSSSSITFAATYGTPPVCLFAAADANSATMATSTYATSTPTTLTIVHVTSSLPMTWNYFCIKSI